MGNDNLEFQHVHFVGVGGIGMSGIARILLQMGHQVSGSDLKINGVAKRLADLGAKIYCGHDASNVEDADLVVVSSAIPEDNPEVIEAKRRGIRVVQRGKMLSWLFNSRVGIAISGTHGKTTTSSMVASMLNGYGLRPTVVVGGEINDIGSNANLGSGDYMVAEADESDASFVELRPEIAVITSMDPDVNLGTEAFCKCGYDYEATRLRVEEMFKLFIGCVKEHGLVVLCVDHPRVKEMKGDVKQRVVTYGLDPEADICALDIVLENYTSRCRVSWRGRIMGELRLPVPGKHNIQNALAAVAIGLEVGMDFSDITRLLGNFHGVRRRFQIVSQNNGITIVDDYAHNPSKVQAAIHAARTGSAKRVIAVFQPHRYTRTKFFKEAYSSSFDEADVLLVTDIYSAGESPIPGISLESFVDSIRASEKSPEVVAVPTCNDIIAYLNKNATEGDIVLFLGAGDISSFAYRASEELTRVKSLCSA